MWTGWVGSGGWKEGNEEVSLPGKNITFVVERTTKFPALSDGGINPERKKESGA